MSEGSMSEGSMSEGKTEERMSGGRMSGGGRGDGKMRKETMPEVQLRGVNWPKAKSAILKRSEIHRRRRRFGGVPLSPLMRCTLYNALEESDRPEYLPPMSVFSGVEMAVEEMIRHSPVTAEWKVADKEMLNVISTKGITAMTLLVWHEMRRLCGVAMPSFAPDSLCRCDSCEDILLVSQCANHVKTCNGKLQLRCEQCGNGVDGAVESHWGSKICGAVLKYLRAVNEEEQAKAKAEGKKRGRVFVSRWKVHPSFRERAFQRLPTIQEASAEMDNTDEAAVSRRSSDEEDQRDGGSCDALGSVEP